MLLTGPALPTATSFMAHRMVQHGAVDRICGRHSELSMTERLPSPDAGAGERLRTVALALLSVQCAFGLLSERELGGVITHFADPTLETNYFGTILDSVFLSYSGNVLLSQLDLIKEPPTATEVSLNDLECQITLNIGREPGTWMPKDWAASGARLSLPLRVRFSDEIVDLGYPGEETLGGSRYAKKIYCDGGTFIGPAGVTTVRVCTQPLEPGTRAAWC
jgi:hypothetical protein